MREIKFRAWDGKKMWYVPELAEIEFNKDGAVEVCVWGDCDGLHHNYGHRSVKLGCSHEDCSLKDFYGTVYPMQFTGLTDVGGNEIYEGDIVQRLPKENYLHFFSVEWCGADEGWGLSPTGAYKIIGNIYENSELLS